MAEQTLNIPELSVVVLVGASGAGKSTFARRWFLPTEIVSSDFCRALVADDENDQAATPLAFEVLHTIVAKRLELGKLTVIDATNLYPEDRKQYLELAREYHAIPCRDCACAARVGLSGAQRHAHRPHPARGRDSPTGGGGA
jgi:protein phosphatase